MSNAQYGHLKVSWPTQASQSIGELENAYGNGWRVVCVATIPGAGFSKVDGPNDDLMVYTLIREKT
jgi:hypothetical protein